MITFLQGAGASTKFSEFFELTAWEFDDRGIVITKIAITGEADSFELRATADRLDLYTALNTKRLASYALYSPAETAIEPEQNAQEELESGENFVPAWQNTLSTQAALPEEMESFYRTPNSIHPTPIPSSQPPK